MSIIPEGICIIDKYSHQMHYMNDELKRILNLDIFSSDLEPIY